MKIIRLVLEVFKISDYRAYARTSHEGYARKIDVNARNNLRLTREVLIVTLNGGALLHRDLVPDLEITTPLVLRTMCIQEFGL